MSNNMILVTSRSDELVRELSAYCQSPDVEVRWATDARQALFMTHKYTPDAVIMDETIPLEDAHSVFQLMYTERRLRVTRMIVLAAKPHPGMRSRMQEMGVNWVERAADAWSALAPLLCHLFGERGSPGYTAFPIPNRAALTTAGPSSPHAPLVLVIDDDVAVTQAVNVRMAANGYRVICSHNGVDAFAIARAQQPDVVTLDVGLPHMDGLGLMQNLSTHPATAHIPIIVLTGRRDEQLERVFRDMGALAFMTKPFSTQHLLEEIARAVRLYGKRKVPARRK